MSNKVDEYINKQASPQKDFCQALRKLIFKTFPDVKEEMKWGVPTFAEGKFYIVALKNHVNLGFAIEGLTAEETALFQGSGETMRHVKVESTALDEEKLAELMRLVKRKAKPMGGKR